MNARMTLQDASIYLTECSSIIIAKISASEFSSSLVDGFTNREKERK